MAWRHASPEGREPESTSALRGAADVWDPSTPLSGCGLHACGRYIVRRKREEHAWLHSTAAGGACQPGNGRSIAVIRIKINTPRSGTERVIYSLTVLTTHNCQRDSNTRSKALSQQVHAAMRWAARLQHCRRSPPSNHAHQVLAHGSVQFVQGEVAGSPAAPHPCDGLLPRTLAALTALDCSLNCLLLTVGMKRTAAAALTGHASKRQKLHRTNLRERSTLLYK